MSEESEVVAGTGQRDEIFVRGLAFNTRELTLARHIETVAAVKDVHILMTFNNRSKGCAFVHLVDPNKIDEVVEKLNGKALDGRFIEITRAKPYSELPTPSHRRRNNYYDFYPGYPPRRFYPNYAPPPPRRGTYHRPAPAPAVEEEDASFRRRRKRDVNPERKKSELTVAVLNLPFVVKEDDMKDIFDGFEFVNPKISRAPDGQSRGVGFVTLLSHEEQQRAIEVVNLNIVNRRTINVVEAFLLPSDLEEEQKLVEEYKKNKRQ